MTDITKCLNESCPIKHKCYRWTAPASDWQSIADFKPNDDGTCDNLYERNNYKG